MLEEGNFKKKRFYSATRKLASSAVAPQWTVKDLFPGQEPAAISNEVLDFYDRISIRQADPMLELVRCHGGLEEISPE